MTLGRVLAAAALALALVVLATALGLRRARRRRACARDGMFLDKVHRAVALAVHLDATARAYFLAACYEDVGAGVRRGVSPRAVEWARGHLEDFLQYSIQQIEAEAYRRAELKIAGSSEGKAN